MAVVLYPFGSCCGARVWDLGARTTPDVLVDIKAQAKADKATYGLAVVVLNDAQHKVFHDEFIKLGFKRRRDPVWNPRYPKPHTIHLYSLDLNPPEQEEKVTKKTFG